MWVCEEAVEEKKVVFCKVQHGHDAGLPPFQQSGPTSKARILDNLNTAAGITFA